MNIMLGTAVAFYSGSPYLVSAWKGLRRRFVSIDVPIALGILVLFFRSVYEILTDSGPGFMDSLAGLVFFLLVGKWYQGKTYQALSFERDYRSWFPVAVTTLGDDGSEGILPLKNLKPGMRILVRNKELVPADALLVRGEGMIDYSFVTGESSPVERREGQRVFAGGRQTGPAIELIVEKEVTQSRLTELWNQDHSGHEKRQRWDSLVDVIGKYFTLSILLIAAGAGLYWWVRDANTAIRAVTAVLIVACPCALALTLPFSFGGAMRVFGKNGFYLKRTQVVEAMANADTVVFDKTGTITRNEELSADLSELYAGHGLIPMIRSLVRHSTHPVSVAIYRALPASALLEVDDFTEVPSRGVSGRVDGHLIKVGAYSFMETGSGTPANGPGVHVSADGRYSGFIRITNRYREGMEEVMTSLAGRYELHLLSGDQDSERPHLARFFLSDEHMHFNQAPQDKLNYIRALQSKGKKVLMIGDGLNDAGALRESDCGISVADDIFHFSPACDAILESKQFARLAGFLAFARTSRKIVILSIALSFLYNIAGISFAVAGKLTPVLSAILMPLSSVSVVAFITFSVMLAARRKRLNVNI
jgi:Cu+-exporting ATPase